MKLNVSFLNNFLNGPAGPFGKHFELANLNGLRSNNFPRPVGVT